MSNPANTTKSDDSENGTPPRFLIVTAAVLAVALAGAVAIAGLTAGSTGSGEDPAANGTGPLPLVPVPAPQAGRPECGTLIGALPEELTSAGDTLARRELAKPAPEATAAWGGAAPVVLRCGLNQPPELNETSGLRVINGVQWLQVPGEGSATWFVVDRDVVIALTVPDSAGTGPLQQISDTVSANLEPAPPRT
ncbi:Protein of unknown function [Amycolatopsis marina]|uniref:DUF3515 domain-containing protein n=1 Tax=Amycolatopsis marina TaxID=490629 RepID=A0A1I0YH58_9PSEU|nr:DUF3515 domain-containing protein [Amycolatopsis marina]SFB12076.1 Protein of unknown function [Amycolatopsis marina]